MSWILGFVGNRLTAERRDELAAAHESELFRSVAETYYVAVGGLVKTCHFGALPAPDEGHWCVVGTGIDQEPGGCRILSSGDWRRLMSSRRPRPDSVGGGFVGLRWSSQRAEAFSDILGLRTLYWTRLRDGFAFSTRLDWLAALRGGCSVNAEAFGSHWLARHQLSFECLADDVDRLAPGGRLALTNDTATAEHVVWEPSEDDTPTLPGLLSEYLVPEVEQKATLGLSGGMNSRLLLALRPRDSGLSVHSFGPAERPDVAVATQIADSLGVSMSHFHLPLPDVDAVIALLREHAVQTNAVAPVSAVPMLRYYSLLHAQGKLVIDGGFGELVRQDYLRRLISRGRSAVESKRAPEVFEYVRFDRVDVLSPEYAREMGFAARRDLQNLLDAVPPASKIGVESVVDRIGVRTRLPNFFGFERARQDSEVRSYMPFAQPPVLDAALRLPPAVRKRMARSLIARREPTLRQFPIVIGDAPYSYRLPDAVISGLVRIRRLLRGRQAERRRLLEGIRTYVLDRMHSDEVRSSRLYDASKLHALAEAYYRNGSRAAEVDWWLALDFWRQAIERGRPRE